MSSTTHIQNNSASPLVVSGKIFGEDFAKKLTGDNSSHPLDAYVQCDSVSTTTAADGSYMLTLKASVPHSCVISAKDHQLENIILDQNIHSPVRLDFGTQPVITCAKTAHMVTCPGLPLMLGSIHGYVRFHGQPYYQATVHCSSTNQSDPLSVTATTDATGYFATPAIAPNTYFCYSITSDHQSIAQNITVAPYVPSQQQLSICANDCPALSYNGGQVMHGYTAYLIYWLPHGYAFEPNGSDQRYMNLTSQYFQDVGGTPFAHLLTQYWDTTGFASDAISLGGTYVDTQPYQHCQGASACTPAHASMADPLQPSDISAEVSRAQTANHWTGGATTEFFVYVGDGVQACISTSICTYIINNQAMCGYHSFFNAVPYAFISDSATTTGACNVNIVTGLALPNRDWIADTSILTTSHEQFESITDPLTNAWYQGKWDEIGDLCENDANAMGYVTLNHGHTYFVQGEWSNMAGGCAL